MCPKRACYPLLKLCSITGEKRIWDMDISTPSPISISAFNVSTWVAKTRFSISYLHHFGETFGNLTGKRMMDLPSLSQKAQRESHFRLADLISWEYAEVKKIRVPMYYRLEHEISGSLRCQYTKIVLPPIRNKLFLTTRLTAPLEIHNQNTTR